MLKAINPWEVAMTSNELGVREFYIEEFDWDGDPELGTSLELTVELDDGCSYLVEEWSDDYSEAVLAEISNKSLREDCVGLHTRLGSVTLLEAIHAYVRISEGR